MLAGSRRGGRRVRKAKTGIEGSTGQTIGGEQSRIASFDVGKPTDNLQSEWQSPWQSSEANADAYQQFAPSPNINASVDKAIASAEIQNPSDALEILAQVAGDAQADRSTSTAPPSETLEHVPPIGQLTAAETHGLLLFPPVAKGIMPITLVNELFDM